MTEKEKDRLLNELKAAADVRDRYRQILTTAQGRLVELRAKLRATHEAKNLAALKRTIKVREKDLAAACDSHDQVEAELLTGMTGLELFDAPKKGTKVPELATAGAVAS
jgi:hypothetical protein